MNTATSFADQRLAATREFAHTLIVVDDEAWNGRPRTLTPRSGLKPPRRRAQIAGPTEQPDLFQIRHALATEELVGAAMNLGLVCSVIRPPKGKSIRSQIGSAARRADIVCLDWELHGDGGSSATKMIAEIVRADDRQNGRLRLISVYTGDTNNNQILETIFNALPKAYRAKHGVKRDPICIESNNGLRIVCLFKAHGVQLADARKDRQIREADLPARLQREFAALAGGLLSNIALGTIASIRDSTHHILANMTDGMDAPYFHHRAILPLAGDAEEYGVDVVLSELKSAVDKKGVAQKYAGPGAIAARIREIAHGAESLRLRYLTNGGTSAEFEVQVDQAIKLITDGNASAYDAITGTKPARKAFAREITSLFTNSRDAAHAAMREFAVLTEIRAHPGNHLYKNNGRLPRLGLGTIVQDAKRKYLLCLQASCDAVRVKKGAAFLFVPLELNGDNADHFVPVLRHGGKVECVGLSLPSVAYAHSKSIEFEADSTTQTVVAQKMKSRRGLYFISARRDAYFWVADLKQRRALRTAQKLGQSIGRLGFDEFEPFRHAEG